MTRVDSKGRIVLPKELRDRLGITPGTEVEIREEDGRAVVEPEDDPQRIIDGIEGIVEEATSDRAQDRYDELDPASKAHVDAIRRQATDR